jgi:hypothetical protein
MYSVFNRRTIENQASVYAFTTHKQIDHISSQSCRFMLFVAGLRH